MSQCKCSMSISVLGDGCRYCQPQEYIDRLSEMLDDERADHLASHAFDEAVERAAFEVYMIDEGYGFKLQRNNRGTYSRPGTLAVWIGWRECAKSRSKRFGGAE